jgi:hypothetical protein
MRAKHESVYTEESKAITKHRRERSRSLTHSSELLIPDEYHDDQHHPVNKILVQ